MPDCATFAGAPMHSRRSGPALPPQQSAQWSLVVYWIVLPLLVGYRATDLAPPCCSAMQGESVVPYQPSVMDPEQSWKPVRKTKLVS